MPSETTAPPQISFRRLSTVDEWIDYDGERRPIKRPLNVLSAPVDNEPAAWLAFRRFRDFDHLDSEVSEIVEGPFLYPSAPGWIIYIESIYVVPERRGDGLMRALVGYLANDETPAYAAFREVGLSQWFRANLRPAETRPDRETAEAFRQWVIAAASDHAELISGHHERIEEAGRGGSVVDRAQAIDGLIQELWSALDEPGQISVRAIDNLWTGVSIEFVGSDGRRISIDNRPLGAPRPDASEDERLQSRRNRTLWLLEALLSMNELTEHSPGRYDGPLGEFIDNDAFTRHLDAGGSPAR